MTACWNCLTTSSLRAERPSRGQSAIAARGPEPIDAFLLSKMYREPNGGFCRRRPRHAMGPASGNENMVARTQSALTFALDP